jgi:hypothetical protein
LLTKVLVKCTNKDGIISLARRPKKLDKFSSIISGNIIEEQSSKEDVEDIKRARLIEEILWGHVESLTETHKDIVITSAVLIKVAISLYTTILEDDKDVEKIAHAAMKTIPQLRVRMEKEIYTPPIIH